MQGKGSSQTFCQFTFVKYNLAIGKFERNSNTEKKYEHRPIPIISNSSYWLVK